MTATDPHEDTADVSVLIPAFNRADTLRAAAESVMAQTLPPAEIVIADDGSTDATSEVVSDLRRNHPRWEGRLVYIRQENQGKSVALNSALGRARGKWIAFNDSDDLWLPEKLALQMALLENLPACGACVSDTRHGAGGGQTTMEIAGLEARIDDGELIDAPRIFCGLSHGIMMQTLVVRRDILETAGCFDPRLRAGQDMDILFRISLHTPIGCIREPLVVLDREETRPARLTKSYPLRGIARLRMRADMMRSWVELARSHRPALVPRVRRRLASVHSALANELRDAGRGTEAAAEMTRACRESPRPALLVKWLLFRLAPAGPPGKPTTGNPANP